ncbi:hypothetical protein EXIGLDRAFT_756151 [Exidia glandulosa HHB12029]|uniref:F-box domain-containing protein n=1 Tax=Exidia glandulosa HHB12029 TaxID=1314781 RepID=A0A165BGU8_EXIGL|nr:hypothetical protein EXIGLDRAFT_756151 [Exidia glandulosa HHB12029]
MFGPGTEAAAALRVPYDGLEHVAVFADQASLLALCHVSHEVSSMATRQLYRYVVFTHRNGHAAVNFLELITRNQSLGKLVVSLTIQVASHLSPASYRIFVDALRLMRMLRQNRHLDITNIEVVGNGCTDVLRGLKRLESFKYLAWHNVAIDRQ